LSDKQKQLKGPISDDIGGMCGEFSTVSSVLSDTLHRTYPFYVGKLEDF
jgi:hypothetical protein